MRIIFEHTHSCFGRIEARSTAVQDVVTSGERALQSAAICALFFWRHLAAFDRPGPAVDNQSKFLCLHVWLILRGLFRCSCESSRRFFGERGCRCTKDHESKEAIGCETPREFHRPQCKG